MSGDDFFWVVWNPRAGVPTVRHDSEHSARAEAERLARCNPGHSFHVLQAIATCRKTGVEWREISKIPF